MASCLNITVSKRRDRLSIIAEILKIVKHGTLKTPIMYKANLSFNQLNGYLKFMLKISLLKKICINGRYVYSSTKKGEEFLLRHFELTKLLKETR